MFKGTTVS